VFCELETQFLNII